MCQAKITKYLRVKELDQKWSSGHVPNWSMIMNKLLINEKFTERVNKYLIYEPVNYFV